MDLLAETKISLKENQNFQNDFKHDKFSCKLSKDTEMALKNMQRTLENIIKDENKHL